MMSMEVVRSEERGTWSFASPFAFVLQNYDFICAPTMFYCLNLNSFIRIAVKFAQLGVFALRVQAAMPEHTPCSQPVKEHLLRISFFPGPFAGSDSALARVGPQSRFSANCKRVLRVGIIWGLLEML